MEETRAPATLEAVRSDGRMVLRVSGRLDVASTPALWEQSREFVDSGQMPDRVDVSDVASCDSAGAAWLVWLGAPVSGANGQVGALLELVRPRAKAADAAAASQPAADDDSFVHDIGGGLAAQLRDIRATIAYVGTLLEGLGAAVRRPGSVRKKDLVLYMTHTGSEALPIVTLIAFLVGVIIAFQSAVQLEPFGVGLYVADAVAIGIVMELGPLMTAIIMAGRSGSAFAAEIGTMKVNEEVDALDTMGLDSTRFLVMPKFIALVLMMPLLVTFACFAGVTGGLLIGVTSLNLPAGVYIDHTVESLTLWRAAQGFIKGECYAVVIAAVGCLRGLQTKTGAQGVGLSTTSAVVSGIFLIIVVDAVLTVIFTYVG